jgi:hypothetical protein
MNNWEDHSRLLTRKIESNFLLYAAEGDWETIESKQLPLRIVIASSSSFGNV